MSAQFGFAGDGETRPFLARKLAMTPKWDEALGAWINRTSAINEPRYFASLAELVLPPYVSIDLSAWKELAFKPGDRPGNPDGDLAVLVSSLVNNGVMVDDTRYYVSGTAQSTKTGLLYAYAEKAYMRKYFSKIKDAVRGSALHVPAQFGISPVESVILRLTQKSGEKATADGQMAAGTVAWAKLTNEPVPDGATSSVVWQVRIWSEEGVLLKGTLRHNPNLGLDELAVLAENVKGDGASGLIDGAPIDVRCALIARSERRTMDIRHQTLSYVTQYPAFTRAWEAEREGLLENFHQLFSSPDSIRRLARFADGPCRKEDGQTIDLMAVIGHAAKFCLDVGNTALMESRGISNMIREMAIAEATRLALGHVEATLLMAQCLPFVKPYEAWVNPRDFMAKGDDGRWHMPTIVLPDGTRREIKSGDLVRVGRMPDTCGGVRAKIRFSKRVQRGTIVVDAQSFAVTGADFDGDWLYIVIPSSLRERAIVDNPQPKETEDKGRAGSAVPDTLEEAILVNLQMNVGHPFALIQQAFCLRHKAERLGLANKGKISEFVARALPWLAHQGQLGVDNAKRFGMHDTAGLIATGKKFRELGLEKADMHWYHLSRGDIRPWDRASLAKPGLLPEGTDPGWVVNPSELCAEGISPIGDMFNWAGKHVVMPAERVRDNAEFRNKLPSGVGEPASWARRLLKEVNEEYRRISSLQDEDEREKASLALTHRLNRAYAYLSKRPSEMREFLLGLWEASFAGQQSQRLLWRIAPDEVFALLYEFADLWRIPEGSAKPWTCKVYGQPIKAGELPEGVYEADVDTYESNGRRKERWSLRRPDGKVFWVLTADGFPFSGIRETVRVHLRPSGKDSTALLSVMAGGAGAIGDKETRLSDLLNRAGLEVKKRGDFFFAGDMLRSKDGVTWEKYGLATSETEAWLPISADEVRAIARARINTEEIAKAVSSAIERRKAWELESGAGIDAALAELGLLEDILESADDLIADIEDIPQLDGAVEESGIAAADLILFTGSRSLAGNPEVGRIIREVISQNPGCNVIVGDAPGVDAEVIRICDETGTFVTVYGANGTLRNRSASPDALNLPLDVSYSERDLEMVKATANAVNPLVVAIWDGESRGTLATFTAARNAGVRTVVKEVR